MLGRNAIECCAPSNWQEHITKGSDRLHNHSTNSNLCVGWAFTRATLWTENSKDEVVTRLTLMIVASAIPCDLLRLRPHTRIRIFVIPQLFLCRLKNFHVHTYPTLIWIHSSTQDSSGNIGNRACVEVAILNTVFTVKNRARSCYVTG